jgi:hypothetical protein
VVSGPDVWCKLHTAGTCNCIQCMVQHVHAEAKFKHINACRSQAGVCAQLRIDCVGYFCQWSDEVLQHRTVAAWLAAHMGASV